MKAMRLLSTLWIALGLFGIATPCASAASGGDGPSPAAVDGGPPVYRPPEPDGEIRRRERSVEEGEGGSRGFARGLSRGFARGITRGFARGLSRGYARGLTRGFGRGLTRGFARGLSRGFARGLTRGFSRGLTRGFARGLTRGLTSAELAALEEGLSEAAQSDPEMQILNIPLPATLAPAAPRRIGWTSRPDPDLVWFISAPFSGPVEFTLNRRDRIDPVIQETLEGDRERGYQIIALSDYGIRLEPGIEYEWFVAIVPIPSERSFDYLASAALRYVPLSQDLARWLSNSTPADRYGIYLTEGYWYDGLSDLHRLIRGGSPATPFRERRMALMTQVGLPPLADFDRELISGM